MGSFRRRLSSGQTLVILVCLWCQATTAAPLAARSPLHDTGFSQLGWHQPGKKTAPILLRISDMNAEINAYFQDLNDTGDVARVQFQPDILSNTVSAPSTIPAAETPRGESRFRSGSGPGTFGELQGQPTTNFAIVFGGTGDLLLSTDVGSLISKSLAALGVASQNRNAVTVDARPRSSRVGATDASSSYWVPARIDLDTMFSKIDSRIVQQTTIIKGPYSALYGPNFNFFDVELLSAPRYDGYETHGSTSADYKSNGGNWYGRQSVWGGNTDWGYRVGYGHRAGNDYESGDGTQMPASYKSRHWDGALGADLTSNSRIDFHYLRADQTDIELPGQAMDINVAVTDAYKVMYRAIEQPYFDRLDIEAWYNRTWLEGDFSRPGKIRQFPSLFFGPASLANLRTDVDSMSVGYQAKGSWENASGSVSVGSDLRYVKQELNEFASQGLVVDANSPIPRSHLSIPGLFIEAATPEDKLLSLRLGGRVDWASANLDDDTIQQTAVSLDQLPYEDILGSSEFAQHDTLLLAYAAVDAKLTDRSTSGISFGYAMRPPNLTERYAAEPFMFLLQNGLSTITGDPTLEPERLWQLDVRYEYDAPYVRTGVNGFVLWARDYITFENLSVVPLPANDQQVNLKYVNTSLATFSGFEWYAEVDVTGRLTPFATMEYVRGTDEDRDGDFDTVPAEPGMASSRNYGLARGTDSGVSGADSEPLPGILPLEARVGIRLHAFRSGQQDADEPWSIELSTRLVDEQHRVAESLLESTSPGFTVWDVRGYWRPRPNFTLVGGVENFTDRNYREHLDFRSPNGLSVLQPGINFYSGAELTY